MTVLYCIQFINIHVVTADLSINGGGTILLSVYLYTRLYITASVLCLYSDVIIPTTSLKNKHFLFSLSLSTKLLKHCSNPNVYLNSNTIYRTKRITTMRMKAAVIFGVQCLSSILNNKVISLSYWCKEFCLCMTTSYSLHLDGKHSQCLKNDFFTCLFANHTEKF